MTEDMDETPAFPPNDYRGSIADWCIEMAARGYPEDYETLIDMTVPNRVWWEVLEACEGLLPGECSIHCQGDSHDRTCRKEEFGD